MQAEAVRKAICRYLGKVLGEDVLLDEEVEQVAAAHLGKDDSRIVVSDDLRSTLAR